MADLPARPYDRTLFDTTVYGVRLVIRLADHNNSLEFLVEAGHRDPRHPEHKHLVGITRDEFRMLLDVERAGLAAASARAWNDNEEDNVQGSLYDIAEQLNPHDPESFAGRLVAVLRGEPETPPRPPQDSAQATERPAAAPSAAPLPGACFPPSHPTTLGDVWVGKTRPDVEALARLTKLRGGS